MNAVGVHIFAGGFSLGVERHLTVLAHLEGGSFGVETWRRNRPASPVYVDKVKRWPEAALALRGQPVDLVYGNPPCSGFSLLNIKGRGPWASINSCIADVVGVGVELRARFIVVESVRQALTNGREFFRRLWEPIADLYPGELWLRVNAHNHGVCQWRPRVFWVLGPEVFFPGDSRRAAPDLRGALAGIPAEAPNQEPLDDLLDAETRATFPFLLPGQSVAALPAEALPEGLRARRDRNRVHLHWPTRLRADRPARVIYSAVKWVHPTEPRLLTARECGRLMGFPDDFELVGHRREWLAQLGKGICPPVGEWLAGELAAYVAGKRMGGGSGTMVVTVGADQPPWGKGHAGGSHQPVQGSLFAR